MTVTLLVRVIDFSVDTRLDQDPAGAAINGRLDAGVISPNRGNCHIAQARMGPSLWCLSCPRPPLPATSPD